VIDLETEQDRQAMMWAQRIAVMAFAVGLCAVIWILSILWR
jgi:hypothetical protein